MSIVFYVCVAVPDAPRSVEIVSSLPTEIHVSVEPPDEDGGMPVTGYRVEFEDQAQDFDLSELSALHDYSYALWNFNPFCYGTCWQAPYGLYTRTSTDKTHYKVQYCLLITYWACI